MPPDSPSPATTTDFRRFSAGVVGGSLAVDPNDWLTVEGRGVNLRPGSCASGLELTATLLSTSARREIG